MGIADDATISGMPLEKGPDNDEDLAPNTVVGEYVVEKKLGEGGFGAVYKAVHPLIGKTAAVKVLHRAYSSDTSMVSRFVSEARAVNQIRNRNIIDIFAFGQLADGRHYYMMELLEGQGFDEYLDQVGRMDLRAAMPILRAVGRALDAAHAQGIVHRDLKPENVFLTKTDDGVLFPKLLDFGIAKLMGAAEEPGGGPTTHKTRTGIQIGTPWYMSPEQCRGIGVDHRTDIYAFGVMTYRVLAGVLPFESESAMDVMMKHVLETPASIASVVTNFPKELDGPVLAMLAKKPEARPQTLAAALDALEAAAVDLDLMEPSTKMMSPQSFAFMNKATPAPQQTLIADSDLPRVARAATAVGKVQTDLGMSDLAEPTTAAKAKKSWIVPVSLVALSAAAVGIYFATQRPTTSPGVASSEAKSAASETARAPVVTTTSVPTALPAASPASLPAVPTTAPSTTTISKAITVKFDITPKSAEIFMGDRKLGVSTVPIELPADALVGLKIVALGYKTKEISVTPKDGLTVTETLTKLPTNRPIHSDLSEDK